MTHVTSEFKNHCVQFLLGAHLQAQQPYGIQKLIQNKLQWNSDIYVEQSDRTFTVVSWNCAGKQPPRTYEPVEELEGEYATGAECDIRPVLKGLKDAEAPGAGEPTDDDFYIIGLQEFVNLNTKSAIKFKDTKRLKLWNDMLLANLNKNCKEGVKYVQVAEQVMVGTCILMYAKEAHLPKIRNVSTTNNKTGFGGHVGNKGSVSINFDFEESSFCFINCHLHHGQKKTARRNEDFRNNYHDTMNKFSHLVSHEKPFHDYKCFFGDLNYRIDEDNQVIRQKVAAKEYEPLIEKDQLLNQRKSNKFLQNFEEGKLSFDPTYRYDKDTDNYDSSKKNRAPAWCDRILFSRDASCKKYLYQDMHSGDDAKAAQPEFYSRSENRFSDHRPVTAQYKV